MPNLPIGNPIRKRLLFVWWTIWTSMLRSAQWRKHKKNRDLYRWGGIKATNNDWPTLKRSGTWCMLSSIEASLQGTKTKYIRCPFLLFPLVLLPLRKHGDEKQLHCALRFVLDSNLPQLPPSDKFQIVQILHQEGTWLNFYRLVGCKTFYIVPSTGCNMEKDEIMKSEHNGWSHKRDILLPFDWNVSPRSPPPPFLPWAFPQPKATQPACMGCWWV